MSGSKVSLPFRHLVGQHIPHAPDQTAQCPPTIQQEALLLALKMAKTEAMQNIAASEGLQKEVREGYELQLSFLNEIDVYQPIEKFKAKAINLLNEQLFVLYHASDELIKQLISIKNKKK
jgi:hypothetical protein